MNYLHVKLINLIKFALHFETIWDVASELDMLEAFYVVMLSEVYVHCPSGLFHPRVYSSNIQYIEENSERAKKSKKRDII